MTADSVNNSSKQQCSKFSSRSPGIKMGIGNLSSSFHSHGILVHKMSDFSWGCIPKNSLASSPPRSSKWICEWGHCWLIKIVCRFSKTSYGDQRKISLACPKMLKLMTLFNISLSIVGCYSLRLSEFHKLWWQLLQREIWSCSLIQQCYKNATNGPWHAGSCSNKSTRNKRRKQT